MEKDNFKEKNRLDIKFSVIAFFVLFPSYWLLGMMLDNITGLSGDGGFLMLTAALSWGLIPCLFVNTLIQIAFNGYSAKNKSKSYLFFMVLNIDIFFFGFITEIGVGDTLIIMLLFILIKYLITRYYYKKLQKITLNSKNLKYETEKSFTLA